MVQCSGVILAGGLNTRFNGENKTLFQINDKPIILYIYDVMRSIFDDLILITNEPDAFIFLDCIIATDIYLNKRSSLTGIHSGLFYAAHPQAFFVPCDTPFIQKELIQFLINQYKPNEDCLLPSLPSGVEPLFGIYSKRCLKVIEKQIVHNQFKISSFFHSVRCRNVLEEDILTYDPMLLSFININTPDQFQFVSNWIKGGIMDNQLPKIMRFNKKMQAVAPQYVENYKIDIMKLDATLKENNIKQFQEIVHGMKGYLLPFKFIEHHQLISNLYEYAKAENIEESHKIVMMLLDNIKNIQIEYY